MKNWFHLNPYIYNSLIITNGPTSFILCTIFLNLMWSYLLPFGLVSFFLSFLFLYFLLSSGLLLVFLLSLFFTLFSLLIIFCLLVFFLFFSRVSYNTCTVTLTEQEGTHLLFCVKSVKLLKKALKCYYTAFVCH